MSRLSLARLLVLIRRERTELLRDRISLAIIVALPLVTLVLFTFALATDVKNMALAVYDASHSPQSRAIIQAVESTGYFQLRRMYSLRVANTALAAGEISAMLVIPPDVGARFAKGQVVEANLVLDGSQTMLAANAEAILQATLANFDVRLRGERLRRASFDTMNQQSADGSGDWPRGRIAILQHALYNPRLDSEHYMIPGLLGYLFTFLTILVAAVSIVRERTIGTFEQLMVTPVTSAEIIIAKLTVLGSAMLVAEALVMVMGGGFFGVWPRGSVVLLFGVTVLYLAVTLSIGLLISAGSRTPDEAVQKSLVAATPLLNVSGLVFPVSSMPYGFQLFAKSLPVYHYLRVSRAIYLTAAGPRDVVGHVAVIGTYLVLLGLLLRWRVGKERRA